MQVGDVVVATCKGPFEGRVGIIKEEHEKLRATFWVEIGDGLFRFHESELYKIKANTSAKLTADEKASLEKAITFLEFEGLDYTARVLRGLLKWLGSDGDAVCDGADTDMAASED